MTRNTKIILIVLAVIVAGGVPLACALGGVGMVLYGTMVTAQNYPDPPVASVATVATEAATNDGELLKTIQMERVAGPFTVRGECELTTYFKHDFLNAKHTHYSVGLNQSDPNALIYAYAPRDSETGKRIFALLGQGQKKILTLECEFVGNEVSVAKLNRIVSSE